MDFLKRLFSRKPEDTEVEAIELAEWLEEISDEALSGINDSLKKALAKAESAKVELKQKLELLEKAELMNAQIPEREKHIMEGNRTNYLRKAYSFSDAITIPDFYYNKIEEFCFSLSKEIEKFNAETAKGYYILTNFFDTEMKNIASSLKMLENSTIEMSHHMESGKLPEYKKLFEMARELKRRFCKHCLKYIVPGANCRVRLTQGKIVYYCLNCKKFMRIPYS